MTESDDAQLSALAGRLFDMREEKRYLESEIEKVSAQLAEALGPGTRRTIGQVEVRVAEARPGLKVVKESAVPASFLTPKPDRKRLLEYVRTTGLVPEGVEVTDGRPTVYTKELPAENS